MNTEEIAMSQEIENESKVEETKEIQEKPKGKVDLKKFLIGFIVGVVACLGMIAFVLFTILN